MSQDPVWVGLIPVERSSLRMGSSVSPKAGKSKPVIPVTDPDWSQQKKHGSQKVKVV